MDKLMAFYEKTLTGTSDPGGPLGPTDLICLFLCVAFPILGAAMAYIGQVST